MTTPAYAFRSPVIQSVRVYSVPAPLVFVITQDPSLMNVVRDLLHQTDDNMTVIWFTSVAGACRRLESGDVAMVIVDGADAGADEAMEALQTASPEAHVLRLTGESLSGTSTTNRPAR